MAYRTLDRATPRRSHPRGAYKALVKPGYVSISQLEAERKRRDDFITGSNWAAVVLCLMFAVMAIGAVWLRW